jgi:hypothetical protein
MTSPSPCARTHLVLVPGFAGFDALGQLEYYAGVTPLLRRWQKGRDPATRVVLHYFDNLPTASVATRAQRLRQYLAKRWARGELQPGDGVALVGHSTGGLDIRRLLLDLDQDARQSAYVAVDGNRDDALHVSPADLLQLVRRVAFLSVPQRGTNIADWVRRLPRRVALAQLRLLVAAARASAVNDVEELAARGAGYGLRSDLLLAVGDAVGEMDSAAVAGDPGRDADAHEAASELALFLTHVASNFAAIDDLTGRADARRTSPAHFTEERREEERRVWRRWGIETRSYATVGRRPYRFAPGEVVPPWELLRPSTWPWSRLVPGAYAWADLAYLCGYRACAGGPFGVPGATGPLVAKTFGTSQARTIEIWDNDGIVNTASMLWPDGEETRLLDGDHGDVLGHFRLVEAADGAPLRRYHTYDLLRSSSGFTEETFGAVWSDVFGFCTGAAAASSSAAA